MNTPSYHHGDLRAALLGLAADHVARSGPASISLRALAAEAGVSHAAPRHHFGSKEGLLTALAAEGYRELAARLGAEREAGRGFQEVGIAYLRFCRRSPGHLAVMFDPDLVLMDDPELTCAKQAAFAELGMGADSAGAGAHEDRAAVLAAAWALVHGLVVLERSGALGVLDERLGADEDALVDLARRATGMLFTGQGAP